MFRWCEYDSTVLHPTSDKVHDIVYIEFHIFICSDMMRRPVWKPIWCILFDLYGYISYFSTDKVRTLFFYSESTSMSIKSARYF